MSGALKGHCLCGAVQIELTGALNDIEVCQCDMCRRWGGSFYPALHGESVVISGEAQATVYRSSDWAERGFCSNCGSSLWFRFLPTGNRSFSAGLFEDASSLPIGREIFVEERADWCRIEGDHKRMTGEETIAEAKAAGFSFE